MPQNKSLDRPYVKFCAILGLGVALATTSVRAQSTFVSYDEKDRTTPIALLFVSPDYPSELKDQKLEGYVDLKFGIRKDGTVKNPKVTSTQLPAPFSAATLDVTRFWIFHYFPYGANCQQIEEGEEYWRLRVWFELDGDRPRISISQPSTDGAPGKPKLLTRASVTWPSRAISSGVRYGCVRAKFGITESGTVKDVEIVDSKPPRVFDYAVLNALPDFRFASTGTDETKVTVVSSIQFHFSLQDY